MDTVEQKYEQFLRELSGQERVQRTLSLFESLQKMSVFQILKEYPSIDAKNLQIKVAEKLYASDPATQSLLKRVRLNGF